MRARLLAAVTTTLACASSTPPPSTAPTPSPMPSATTTSAGAPLPDLLMPSEPTSSPSPEVASIKPPPKNEQPSCATDQDCWSITCCPATTADECVHHSLAQKCAMVDVTCPKLEAHLDCACDKGVCTGRAP